MHSINVFSHLKFDKLMQDNKWVDCNVDNLKDTAFISICCKPEIKKNYLEDYKHETDEHWFKKSHKNVLNIEFDDIFEDTLETEYGKAIGITIDQAKEITNFISENYAKGIKNWYLHCRAGRSRSAAIGIYIMEFLQAHGEQVKDNGFQKDRVNSLVYDRLSEATNV